MNSLTSDAIFTYEECQAKVTGILYKKKKPTNPSIMSSGFSTIISFIQEDCDFPFDYLFSNSSNHFFSSLSSEIIIHNFYISWMYVLVGFASCLNLVFYIMFKLALPLVVQLRKLPFFSLFVIYVFFNFLYKKVSFLDLNY